MKKNTPIPKGYIPFKVWKLDAAQKAGLTLHNFEVRIWRGVVETPPLLRINSRVIFAKVSDEEDEP
jgi:hypothetical protein